MVASQAHALALVPVVAVLPAAALVDSSVVPLKVVAALVADSRQALFFCQWGDENEPLVADFFRQRSNENEPSLFVSQEGTFFRQRRSELWTNLEELLDHRRNLEDLVFHEHLLFLQMVSCQSQTVQRVLFPRHQAYVTPSLFHWMPLKRRRAACGQPQAS